MIVAILATTAVATLLFATAGRFLFRPGLIFEDDLVRVTESRSPISYLLTFWRGHSSKSYIALTVCGTTYQHLCGVPPYYVRLHAPEAVVFATRLPDEPRCEVHVVVLDGCRHAAFDLASANVAFGFGNPTRGSSLGDAAASWADQGGIVDLQFTHPDQARAGHWRLLLQTGAVEVVK